MSITTNKKAVSVILAAALVFGMFIGAAPKTEVNAAARFTDVSSTDWYYNSVEYVASNGIMSGISTTKFNPTGQMTRAQFVTVLYRMTDNAVTVGQPTTNFSDVSAGTFYYEAVNWAVANGITTGIGNNCFGPNGVVTREQMATFTNRYVNKFQSDKVVAAVTPSIYADDSSISAWARDAIYKMTSYGLLTGTTGNKVNPQGILTRAEGATVVMRLHQKIANDAGTVVDTPSGKYSVDKAEAKKVIASIKEVGIQSFGLKENQLPAVSSLLTEAAERYATDNISVQSTVSDNDVSGNISVYEFNNYTNATDLVGRMLLDNSPILKCSYQNGFSYTEYGVAVARAGDAAKVIIVTIDGTTGEGSSPVENPDPTPDPTPTPSTTSNTELAAQLYTLAKVELTSYGVQSVPSRNSQLDKAAELLANGSTSNLDTALKNAGFSKPYTSEYTYWHERYDNVSQNDASAILAYLASKGSQLTNANFKESPAVAYYDDIGIYITGSDSVRTVVFVMYNRTPSEVEVSTSDLAKQFVQEQLDLPLNASAEQTQMLNMINTERAKVGAPELRMLPALNEMACIRAQEYIEARERFGIHKRLDGSSFRTIFSDYNIENIVVNSAENASWALGGDLTPSGAMNFWMNSAGHKANLLSTVPQYVGVAKYYDSAKNNTTWIQLFVSFK